MRQTSIRLVGKNGFSITVNLERAHVLCARRLSVFSSDLTLFITMYRGRGAQRPTPTYVPYLCKCATWRLSVHIELEIFFVQVPRLDELDRDESHKGHSRI